MITFESPNGWLHIDMWYGEEDFAPKKYTADAMFNDRSGEYAGNIYTLDEGKIVGDYTASDSQLISENFVINWGEEEAINGCDMSVTGATEIPEDFAEDKLKFFFYGKFLGSCEPGCASCPKLKELMQNDTDGCASAILNYLNSLGDPVYMKQGSDEAEDDVDNVDIDDLYNTFMQELDYEYNEFPEDFYVGGSVELPDFEIFVGPVSENAIASSTAIKADATSDFIRQNQRRPEGGYLYIFKHGIGPGTIPGDVKIIKVKDLPNYYTAVWLDRWLTTSELKKYDIPSESDINYYLDRIGYCVTDGRNDVVPCDTVPETDGVEACDNVMASTDAENYNDYVDFVYLNTQLTKEQAFNACRYYWNNNTSKYDVIKTINNSNTVTWDHSWEPRPINTVIYRLPSEDCYGYADSGKKIESSCWDWCCMDIVIQNWMDQDGITEDEGVARFWAMVHAFAPEEFDACVEPYGGSALECIGDGNPGLDELRAECLEALGFTEAPADQDNNV